MYARIGTQINSRQLLSSFYAHFPLGDFFRADKQKAIVIGW